VNITAALDHITQRLAAAGIEAPRREARLILAAAHGTDAAGLLRLTEIDQQKFDPLLQRRAAREPLAYILGRKEFWGREFVVSPATLIPRPDSETLIEAALECFPARAAVQNILDAGTGTGCLLLAALLEFPQAFGVGLDISEPAAALARRNAAALGLGHRSTVLVADWAAPINAKFDLILSNPPYIPAPDLPSLMQDVQNYEPRAALDGGPDGLTCYKTIIAALPALLAPAGAAVLELGIGQSAEVAAIAQNAGFSTQTRADLANIPRALVIRP
jgi:release factor glutamine methyltransferase